MILIRGNIPRQLFNEKKSEKVKIINFVVEICKREGVGKLQPKQRIKYSKQELRLINKIAKFVLWISDNEVPNFRTIKETEELIKILLKSLSKNKPILFYALFCPGYKKGRGVYGFNKSIGNTTKRGIKNLSLIKNKAKELKIPYYTKAIYSDLVLENFKKLKTQDFDDLEINFQNFKKYGEKINSSIEYIKLSQIDSCKKKIKIKGIKRGKINLSGKELMRIVKRSFPFYKDILGWDKESIIQRTKILAKSCSFMSREIKKENPLVIMVMVENMYERGKFYQANLENKFLPIFYPEK